MAAPVAHFDEDWSGVLRGSNMVSEQDLLPHKGRAAAANTAFSSSSITAAGEAAAQRLLQHGDADLPALLDGCFPPGDAGVVGSVEELVSGFEDKLAACFHNVTAQTESIAPVSVISEDTLLETDEIWNALTSNYGNVMAVDWKSSRARSLHIPTFNREDKPRRTDVAAELSDDEELREQLDMHSIIVSCLAEEPVCTAEQVIEEIEEMMQDSPDMETRRPHHPSESDPSVLSLDVQRSTSSPGFKDSARTLSVAQLNERLEETEAAIRRFSEELVQQLALRDELDFEKEVKNTFISALIDVQNRQKEQRELLRRRRRPRGGAGAPQGQAEKAVASRFSMEGLSSVIQNSFRQTFGSGCSERQYLTTVIPYEKRGHPPSMEDLQILTKILHAMRDDSDKVPGLLTDYILKVLCPT